MSKPKSKRTAKQKKSRDQAGGVRRAPDRTVYIALLSIGLFAAFILWLITGTQYGPQILLAYVIVLAFQVNLYTLQAYRGTHMANWKCALARVPLRFVGYREKGGKPLDAAHGRPEVHKALMVSLVVSLVLVVGGCVLVLPGVAG